MIERIASNSFLRLSVRHPIRGPRRSALRLARFAVHKWTVRGSGFIYGAVMGGGAFRAVRGSQAMFKLIATMRRGTATDIAAAWARYPTLDAARAGTATLLRDERILRVMIVRNEMPPAFVEWAER